MIQMLGIVVVMIFVAVCFLIGYYLIRSSDPLTIKIKTLSEAFKDVVIAINYIIKLRMKLQREEDRRLALLEANKQNSPTGVSP